MSKGEYQNTEKETIKDPDGHFRTRRGDSILDVRERVFQKRRHALDLLAERKIGDEFAAGLVRQAVEDYIYDSEHVIRGYLPGEADDSVRSPVTKAIEGLQETAGEVWTEVDLGKITTHPGAEDYKITGLKGYMQAPNPVRIQYTTRDIDPVQGTTSQHHEETYQIPMGVSMNAFSQVNRFWNEFGMDVNPDDEIDAVANPY